MTSPTPSGSGPSTPKDADIDYYLQVTASYTDPEGEGKTAMGTSAYVVQGLRSANKAPKFADDQDSVMENVQANAAREIAENTPAGSAIGDPVVAEDEDGDILTYTLDNTSAMSFDIDWATGQIMTKAALNHEDISCGYDPSYTVNRPICHRPGHGHDPDVTNAVDGLTVTRSWWSSPSPT